MELTIISPAKKETLEIAWVEINTPTGNYVIQEGHAPTAFILSSDKLLTYALKNGRQENILIEQGIIDISRTGALVLLNTK